MPAPRVLANPGSHGQIDALSSCLPRCKRNGPPLSAWRRRLRVQLAHSLTSQRFSRSASLDAVGHEACTSSRRLEVHCPAQRIPHQRGMCKSVGSAFTGIPCRRLGQKGRGGGSLCWFPTCWFLNGGTEVAYSGLSESGPPNLHVYAAYPRCMSKTSCTKRKFSTFSTFSPLLSIIPSSLGQVQASWQNET